MLVRISNQHLGVYPRAIHNYRVEEVCSRPKSTGPTDLPPTGCGVQVETPNYCRALRSVPLNNLMFTIPGAGVVRSIQIRCPHNKLVRKKYSAMILRGSTRLGLVVDSGSASTGRNACSTVPYRTPIVPSTSNFVEADSSDFARPGWMVNSPGVI